MERRPIEAREQPWAKAAARTLNTLGFSPNQISVCSVGFAVLAGLGFVQACHHWAWYLLAAACIQLRLLCNLFDGMVAVEGGKKTKSGDVFNELPDRLSDTAVLLGAGYGSGHIVLGWAAALAAMLTAYVRLLGASAGTPQYFFGPMAKQHRMAVMTITALLSIGESLWFDNGGRVIQFALAVITVGAFVTAWQRTRKIIDTLEGR